MQDLGSKGSSISSLRSHPIPESTSSDYENANRPSNIPSGSESDKSSRSRWDDQRPHLPWDPPCTLLSRSSARSDGTATDSSQTPVEGAGGGLGFSDGASGEDLALPTQEEVVKKTEKITKKIQELLVLAQDDKLDR